MAPSRDSERKLLDFLDRQAFEPVLRADPAKFDDGQRAKLKDVQEATRAEQPRYHHYGSARKIVEMFKDDLTSEPAKKVHRELHQLGLPSLDHLRDEFAKLAEEMGI